MAMLKVRPLSPDDLEALRALPMFYGLPDAVLAELLAGATVRRFGADTLLFNAGDPVTRFFVVLEGAVRLFALDEDGQQGVLEILHPVRSFAEAAMFGSGRYPLNAEATRGTTLVQIEAGAFLRHLRENRQLARDMIANLHHWERRLLEEIGQVKFLSPAQRLSSFLLGLTERSAGEARFRLPMSKATIASRIGIEPESLSRALQRLRHLGVTCHGDEVRIADVAALRRYCAGH